MEDNERKDLRKLLSVLGEKLKKPENHWLFDEFRVMLDNADISDIRDVLNIKGHRSIDYSFIKGSKGEERLREQLEIDNQRMENAATNTQISNENERLFNYCANAFYQVENIINYYYYKRFSDVKDLVVYLKNNNEKFSSLGNNQNIKTVADVQIVYKMFTIGDKLLLPSESIRLNSIRFVRNEGFHRCSIILSGEPNNKDEEKIKRVFKEETFNSIRILLKNLVTAIKESIDNGFKDRVYYGIVDKINPFLFTVKIDGIDYVCESKIKEGIKNGDLILIKNKKTLDRNKIILKDYCVI